MDLRVARCRKGSKDSGSTVDQPAFGLDLSLRSLCRGLAPSRTSKISNGVTGFFLAPPLVERSTGLLWAPTAVCEMTGTQHIRITMLFVDPHGLCVSAVNGDNNVSYG